MNKLMQRLGADYRGLVDEYETILNRCGDQERDPTDAEAAQLEQLRSDMQPLGERLIELRETDDRRWAATRAMTPEGGDAGGAAPVVAGTGASVVHTRTGPPSLTVPEHQIRALMAAAAERRPYNEPIETRAAVETPAAGSVPFWSYPATPSGVETRLADKISTRPAAEGNIVSYLAVTAPAVLAAVAEGAAKPDSGLVVSRRQANVVKGAAFSDTSWEMLADFEDVAGLINMELQSGLIRFENSQILAAIAADAGILHPTPVATSPLISVWQAKQAVRAAPNVGDPDIVIMHPSDWAIVAAEEATTSGLLLGGPQAVQFGPATTAWGMEVFQTVAQTPTHVTLGVSDAAGFFLRDPARIFLDIYTKSVNNLQTVIIEERFAVGVLNPGRWATYTLPGGAITAEAANSGKAAAGK